MTSRTCYTCKIEKPLEEFPRRKDKPLGHGYQCKVCNYAAVTKWRHANREKAAAQVARYQKKYPEKVVAYQLKWRKANPRSFKNSVLKCTHGITLEQYEEMLTAQNGRCAICDTSEPRGRHGVFHVDHCHETSVIRGLLCHGCNLSIGHFHHDPLILQAAIRYLGKLTSRTQC
jgi:Recombination endonuclease VII